MRGRKPIPTATKIANGNPGKRALNDAEPTPAIGLGKPPAALSPAGKKLWKDLAGRMEKAGIGTEADREAFAMLVESYTAWLKLVSDARAQGPIVKVNGQPVPNPLLKRADVEAEKVRKLLVEFGLTPSSRSRVKVNPQEEDDLAAFMSAQDTPVPGLRVVG